MSNNLRLIDIFYDAKHSFRLNYSIFDPKSYRRPVPLPGHVFLNENAQIFKYSDISTGAFMRDNRVKN